MEGVISCAHQALEDLSRGFVAEMFREGTSVLVNRIGEKWFLTNKITFFIMQELAVILTNGSAGRE